MAAAACSNMPLGCSEQWADMLLEEEALPPQRTAAAKDLQTTQSAAQRNAASLSRAKPSAAPAPAKSPAPNPNRQRPQDVVRDAMKVWGEMNR